MIKKDSLFIITIICLLTFLAVAIYIIENGNVKRETLEFKSGESKRALIYYMASRNTPCEEIIHIIKESK